MSTRPVALADPARTARLLRRTLSVLLAATVGGTLLLLPREADRGVNLALGALLAVGWGALRHWVQQGHLRRAAYALTAALWLTFTVLLLTSRRGVHGVLGGGYLLVIILAGVTLDAPATRRFGALCLVGALATALAEAAGWLTLAPPPPLAVDLITLVTLLLLTTLLLHFTVTGRAQALRQARQHAAHLRRRTAELAAARDRAQAANRAKATFLATMSHELRTPLNAIIGFTQILLERPDATSTVGLETILSSSQHLLHLVNDVLTLSQLEAGTLRLHVSDFHLPHLLHHLIATIQARAAERGLAFAYDLDEDLPLGVRGDQACLRRVLENLLSNAVTYTPQGQVTFEVRVTRAAGRAHLRFSVADTGVGLAPQILARVMQPFERASPSSEGTGLGLALVKHLVQRMDGRLHVTSTPGVGSRFEVRLALPVVTVGEQTDAWAGMPVGYTAPRRYRILVVDDAPPSRLTLRHILALWGFDVQEAADGPTALTLAAAQRPDLILMDIVMPGMTGVEATQQLRQDPALRDIVVIATTGSRVAAERQDIFPGYDGWLEKPVDLQILVTTLAQHLGLAWRYRQPDRPAATARLRRPPAEIGRAIQALLAQGNLPGIGELAHDLARDAAYRPFADALRRAAEDFDEAEIRSLVDGKEAA